jgi:hypothetical protein
VIPYIFLQLRLGVLSLRQQGLPVAISAGIMDVMRFSFPGSSVKYFRLVARWYRICLQCRRPRFDPWIREIPWRMEWQTTPVFFPGEFYGQRSLVGSPWDHKEFDITE